jgi:hypothetical protein
MIPTSLRHRAVSWYHHYLQHPRHLRLEETMRSMMYWKGMCTTIRRYIKTCRSCQVNKRHSQKYGHLPPKMVIMTPWKALCVDLIGPYTLKRKDSSSIDFMSSEVQNKMIIMGHQISSYHVPVVGSFFILEKMPLSSLNLPFDHLPKYTNIIFHYPKM